MRQQAVAGRRDGNFHAPAGACATERALAKIILFHLMMEPRVK